MTRQRAVRPTTFRPSVALSSGRLVTPCDKSRERSRLEWWVGDSGEPAILAAGFLANHGLALPVRRRPGRAAAHPDTGICGAAIFVSAAAAAAMIGAPAGPGSPAPHVPDLAVVVYTHAGAGGHTGLPDRSPAGRGCRPMINALVAVPTTQDAPGLGWRLGPWRPSWSAAEHAAAVAEIRVAIARGEVYQVNVVGHAAASYRGDPWPALCRLAALPGARYGGILAGDGWAVASASPELLLRVRAGMVETRPIKGTRPATAAGRRELLDSAKERAEHVMIVDLERNDLGRVARTGTVDVPELFAVRRWCDLWQAESRVTAHLADGIDLADVLRAVCPGGSVTGAPKRAALEQIAQVEPVGRGAAMGALGWLDDERLDLGLTIRTAAVDGRRVHLWAGGGITWDSEPAAEVAEAAVKAAPLHAALSG